MFDTRFKQRAVIEFLVNSVDIHRRWLVVYGTDILDVSSVRCWVLRVKDSEVGNVYNFRSAGSM